MAKFWMILVCSMVAMSPAFAVEGSKDLEIDDKVVEMLAESHTNPLIFISGGMGMCPGTFTNLETSWYGSPRFISPFELRAGIEVFSPDRVFSIGYLGRIGLLNYHDEFALVSHHLMVGLDTNPNRVLSMRIEFYPVGMTDQLRDKDNPKIVAHLPSSGVGLKFNCKLFRIGPDLFWGWQGDFQVAITVSWAGPI